MGKRRLPICLLLRPLLRLHRVNLCHRSPTPVRGNNGLAESFEEPTPPRLLRIGKTSFMFGFPITCSKNLNLQCCIQRAEERVRTNAELFSE